LVLRYGVKPTTFKRLFCYRLNHACSEKGLKVL
jgi:hypothetical protein